MCSNFMVLLLLAIYIVFMFIHLILLVAVIFKIYYQTVCQIKKHP